MLVCGHIQALTASPRKKSRRHVLDGLGDPRDGLNAFDETKIPCAYNGNRNRIRLFSPLPGRCTGWANLPRSCKYYVLVMWHTICIELLKRADASTLVWIYITGYWNLTQYSLADRYRRFEATSNFQIQGWLCNNNFVLAIKEHQYQRDQQIARAQ